MTDHVPAHPSRRHDRRPAGLLARPAAPRPDVVTKVWFARQVVRGLTPVGKTTAPDGTTTTRPGTSHRGSWRPPTGPESPEQKVARLEAENAALRVEATKLATEREILRQAAKYFARETNW